MQEPINESSEIATKQNFALILIVSVVTSLTIGLVLVWLNLERTKIAYSVRILRQEQSQKSELNSQLSVKREFLLSPSVLGQKAESLGLFTATPGQVRRMGKLSNATEKQ